MKLGDEKDFVKRNIERIVQFKAMATELKESVQREIEDLFLTKNTDDFQKAYSMLSRAKYLLNSKCLDRFLTYHKCELLQKNFTGLVIFYLETKKPESSD